MRKATPRDSECAFATVTLSVAVIVVVVELHVGTRSLFTKQVSCST